MRKSVPAAGAVFAQELEIGGYYRVGADLVNGDNVEDSDMGAGVTESRARLNFKAANDDGTFGGFIRLQARADKSVFTGFDIAGVVAGTTDPADAASVAGHYAHVALAHVWWQPIEQLKLQAGILDDFYVDEIVDEFGANAEQTKVHFVGFYADALTYDDSYQNNGAFGQNFYGGGSPGVALSLYPIEGLAINIGIPVAEGPLAEDVYKNIFAQVQYEIADVGRLSLAFQGRPGSVAGTVTGNDLSASSSAIYAAFYLTMVENMGVNLGLKFTLPQSEGEDDAKVTVNTPFLIGLGFNYDMDALRLAARLGVGLGGSKKYKLLGADAEPKDPTLFEVQILPSYDIGACRIYLNAGLGLSIPDEGDSQTGFYVNPYVEKAVGGGSFYAGFKLYSEPGKKLPGKDDAFINWSVPCGMKFAF